MDSTLLFPPAAAADELFQIVTKNQEKAKRVANDSNNSMNAGNDNEINNDPDVAIPSSAEISKCIKNVLIYAAVRGDRDVLGHDLLAWYHVQMRERMGREKHLLLITSRVNDSAYVHSYMCMSLF